MNDKEESKKLIHEIFKRYLKSMSMLAQGDEPEDKEKQIQNLLKKHEELLKRLADS